MPIVQEQFMRFLLVGGFAAAMNVLSRYLLSQTMPFRWAVLLAYLCGMTTAWLLSRWFVFEASGHHWSRELMRFSLINLFSAAQVWLISVGLAERVFPSAGFTFYPEEVAHLAGVTVPIFSSYFGHRYFSFAPKKR